MSKIQGFGTIYNCFFIGLRRLILPEKDVLQGIEKRTTLSSDFCYYFFTMVLYFNLRCIKCNTIQYDIRGVYQEVYY